MPNILFTLKDVIAKFHTSYGIYVDDTDVYITRLLAGFKEPRVDIRATGKITKEMPLAKHLKKFFPHARPAEERIAFGALFGKSKEKHELTFMEKLSLFLAEMPETLTVGVKDTAVFYYAFAVSQKQTKSFDVDLVVNENQKAEFLHSKKLIYDWRNFQNEDQNFILITASKRASVTKVWKDFDDLGLVPYRFEPGPVSALRAAWDKIPPASKLPELRVLVGPEMTLIALNKGRVPLSWTLVNSTQENFAETLFPGAQNLIIYTRKQFTADGVTKIVMQGQGLDKALGERLAEMTGVPCEMHEFMPYDGHLIAYGLALGALYPEMENINLAREMQKRISLLTTFPYLETFITTGLIALTALYLGIQTERLDKNVRLRSALNSQVAWAALQGNEDIDAAIKRMKGEMGILTEFYSSQHTRWNFILEELGNIVSPGIKVKNITARDPVWKIKGVAKALFLQVECERGADGTRPEMQIEKILDALKQSKVMTKNFQKIQMKAVSMSPDGNKITATIALE